LPGKGGGTRHTQRIEAVPTADHVIILDESSSHIARGEGIVPWREAHRKVGTIGEVGRLE